MKKIKLLNLKLTNFKGIKSFELDAQDNDLKVFGANATGKTTIPDAFNWVLFDKDSNNRSTNNFDIKTIVDGKAVNKLNHEVEVVLQVDENTLTLKKVYKEKWAKKRGSTTDDFTGHTTDYFINEVPSKKKEYDERINELVDEDSFRLLTDPSYFNNLHWKKQRDVLVEVAGDITDEDVISTDKELKKLLEVLNGNSIEDHKKIIAAKRTDINKEIDRIPIRIDEINRNLPDTSDLKESEINNAIESLNAEIKAKNEQINNVKNGSEVVELKKQISELEIDLNKVKANHESEQQQGLYKLQTRLSEEETNLEIMRGKIRPLIQDKDSINRDVESKQEQMNKLRNEFIESKEEYKETSERVFEHGLDETVCPTCSQDLPEQEVKQAEIKFNKNKSTVLEKIKVEQEEINVKGKQLKEEVEQLEIDIGPIDKQINEITEQGKKKESDIAKLKESITKAQSEVVEVTENKDYITLNKDILELKEKALQINESSESAVTEIQKEVTEIEGRKHGYQVDLNKLEQVKQSTNRITELEDEERKLASEFEQLEHQLYLTEEFTRKKVNMLNEKINSKFKYARFNLFEEQINGGLTETCETTFEGIPFTSGLNNAAKINVGLDIINTLTNHYGVQSIIFVDNAESVTDLIDVKSQLISLIVSEQDEELRIETVKEMEVA